MSGFCISKMPLWVRQILARIEAGTSGYLNQVGWPETRARRIALDSLGNPVAWFTYPAIEFLANRVDKTWRVLEFGAGMGTMWWSERVNETVALEHDPAWATQVSKGCRAHVIRVKSATAKDYIRESIGTGPYDLIVVDGVFRNDCLLAAPALLSEKGVIVLDDAQRPQYRAAITTLCRDGFRLIEMHGPQPVSKHPGCTAILYRENNVLNI